MRSPGLVSVARQEPDHWCPVSAAGLKSSLPPWIFHLWILQNQCSVFAFQDRDHGSAFSFTVPYLFVFLRVCTCVSFFNLSPHCLPLGNHNSLCHCFILLLFLYILSIFVLFCHACATGTSKLTFNLFFNLISKPTGYLNTEVFIYIDKFLSLKKFLSQQRSRGSSGNSWSFTETWEK